MAARCSPSRRRWALPGASDIGFGAFGVDRRLPHHVVDNLGNQSCSYNGSRVGRAEEEGVAVEPGKQASLWRLPAAAKAEEICIISTRVNFEMEVFCTLATLTFAARRRHAFEPVRAT